MRNTSGDSERAARLRKGMLAMWILPKRARLRQPWREKRLSAWLVTRTKAHISRCPADGILRIMVRFSNAACLTIEDIFE